MKRMALAAAVVMLAAAPLFGPCGCKKAEDGLSSEQHQKGDRLTEIRAKANGNWDAISKDDQKFLLDMAYGNETSARMLLFKPGGPGSRPPVGGPPRGPGPAPGR